GAGGEQSLDHLAIRVVGGEEQRRGTVRGGRVHVGTRLDQLAHLRDIARACRIDDGARRRRGSGRRYDHREGGCAQQYERQGRPATTAIRNQGHLLAHRSPPSEHDTKDGLKTETRGNADYTPRLTLDCISKVRKNSSRLRACATQAGICCTGTEGTGPRRKIGRSSPREGANSAHHPEVARQS